MTATVRIRRARVIPPTGAPALRKMSIGCLSTQNVTKGTRIGTDGVETGPLTPDLQRLLVAVNTEIDRRRRGASTPSIGSTAPVTRSRPVPVRDEHTNIAEIPEGKANLIRAAFGAGLKTPVIARTFGISLSQ